MQDAAALAPRRENDTEVTGVFALSGKRRAAKDATDPEIILDEDDLIPDYDRQIAALRDEQARLFRKMGSVERHGHRLKVLEEARNDQRDNIAKLNKHRVDQDRRLVKTETAISDLKIESALNTAVSASDHAEIAALTARVNEIETEQAKSDLVIGSMFLASGGIGLAYLALSLFHLI